MQTPRFSTKARIAVETLHDLSRSIHHDRHLSDAELAAWDAAMREAMDWIARTDDALAYGMAALKGGPDAPHARQLRREYEQVHSAPVDMTVHINTKRPDQETGPSAA